MYTGFFYLNCVDRKVSVMAEVMVVPNLEIGRIIVPIPALYPSTAKYD